MTAPPQPDGSQPPRDLIDAVLGLAPGDPIALVRRQRDKVAVATQGSHQALFDPDLSAGDPAALTRQERLQVGLYACRLTPSPALAAHYRTALAEAGLDARRLAVAADGSLDEPAAGSDDPRLAALLGFTRTLVERPVDGDRAALQRLPTAGLSTAAVVALAQLIAYLSYQTRLVAGLAAMAAAQPLQASNRQAAGAGRPAAGTANDGPASGAEAGIIRSHGFTNESLDWHAWLPVVDLDAATPVQIAVLEESHPKAKTSDYYRLLVHQPRVLRERSAAFNAIMYAPGGLPRAERELAATVVSRVNGCVYCASVHAQRFEQLARRSDTIAQVFDDPATAGTTDRERAIVRFAIALTGRPDAVSADQIRALAAVGLDPREILDLIHSVAIFAWANRLMLNLGEPVYPSAPG